MTAKYRVVVRIRGLGSLLNYKRNNEKIFAFAATKNPRCKIGCGLFGKN